jgi:hypothetical protein
LVQEDQCEALNSWYDWTTYQKEDFLTRFINDMLEDLGYDPVDVRFEEIIDEITEPTGEVSSTTGEYSSGRITIDLSDAESSPTDAMDTAIHELWHYAQDMSGESEAFSEEFEEGMATAVAEDSMDTIMGHCAEEELGESAAEEDIEKLKERWQSEPEDYGLFWP